VLAALIGIAALARVRRR